MTRSSVLNVAARVARHRGKLAASSAKRLEVTVPAHDAALVRQLAAVLRAGGEEARRARERLRPLTATRRAASGPELVAFFRSSPLVGEDLVFERDRSPGRPIDI